MFTDITTSALIEKLPEKYRPYAVLARLDRPIGWWLLLLPGLWAITLSADGILNMNFWHYFLIILFFIGAIIMRGAGCVINDLWDRNLDKEVERTRQRPLASGELNIQQALIFLSYLLLAGFAILICMPGLTIALGFLSLPLIAAYPLMKRITYWPQAFLGIVFNFSALMGWSASTGSLGFAAILLYLSGILWTLGYDTIYAHQDKEDDALAGVKSTALKFGKNSKEPVSLFYALSFLCLALSVFISKEYWFSTLLLLPALAHLSWQVKSWNPDNPDSSLKIFKSGKIYGLLVLAVCLI